MSSVKFREDFVKQVHGDIGFAMWVSKWRQFHFEMQREYEKVRT